MSTHNTDFDKLTQAVELLLNRVKRLRLEKQELQLAYDRVLNERDIMISKNETARYKIEQMLAKLECLEETA